MRGAHGLLRLKNMISLHYRLPNVMTVLGSAMIASNGGIRQLCPREGCSIPDQPSSRRAMQQLRRADGAGRRDYLTDAPAAQAAKHVFGSERLSASGSSRRKW